MQEVRKTRVIAVFAHNEAKNIRACLESVRSNIRPGDTCVVLNNGSTDVTGALVAEFSRGNDFCRLVDIDIGDKCNAWNVFIHDLRIEADTFCFLDGDCEILPGSVDALEACLEDHPGANAVAALPADHLGEDNRRGILTAGGLAGNLYALSPSFVRRIREQRVRLPLGLIGDDSLIGALAYWDLEPRNAWDKSKIAVCPDARFSYTPLSRLSFHDVRLYYRRKVRYSLRRVQNSLMRRPLKENGLQAIPRNIDDLYLACPAEVALAWRGVQTWFDWLAIKMIRSRVRARSRARS